MNWKAAPFNNRVNGRASNSSGRGCIVPELDIQLQISIACIFTALMHDGATQIDSATLCSVSIVVTEQQEGSLFKKNKKKVRVSRKTEQCNQGGHSPRLPSLLPDAGLGASVSVGVSPTENVSSNFLKMNSFGDAICFFVRWEVIEAHMSPYASSSLAKSTFQSWLFNTQDVLGWSTPIKILFNQTLMLEIWFPLELLEHLRLVHSKKTNVLHFDLMTHDETWLIYLIGCIIRASYGRRSTSDHPIFQFHI